MTDGIAGSRALLLAGAWVSLATAVGMALSIPAFFAWPPVATALSAGEVLDLLHREPVAGFFHLDPAVLVLNIAQIPVMAALFVALRRVDPGWAWIALLVGVASAVAVVPARPIVELYALAERHAAADPEMQVVLEAAATGLLAQFEGTGWAIATGGIPLSYLVSFVLMLRSTDFARVTAWTGIATSAGSLPFFVPVVGPLLLLFLGTVVGIASCGLVARDLFRLARRPTTGAA